MNLEEPLPASIKVRGSKEIISIWGHTEKTCSKNKNVKDKDNEEVVKEKELGLQETSVETDKPSKSIDLENPVLETRKQESSTCLIMRNCVRWFPKAHPLAIEKMVSRVEVWIQSNDLEEGEVEADFESSSSSSEEESSLESKVVLEKRKQLDKQQIGKNRKNQNWKNPSTNVGNKKVQNKGAKNKQTNQVSSWRH
ncbi:unnamed protein product [Eruca vesicaria subsp. sativa]|uniref:Uncharacterized protein n=1 Tax=Eruca vesicaria subsp. sativa TaxID=29727 RepID=A0ABC8LD61_ERUVS|nr:unnamed protein product [Eruca vesicaria subsp. sativa]